MTSADKARWINIFLETFKMAIKFHGSNQDFVEILNGAFNKSVKGDQVGHAFRYVVMFEGRNHNINLYENGTVNVQPSNDALYEIIRNALSRNVDEFVSNSGEIFVVHGHDKASKQGLENMLYKWGLKPYAIQDEDSRGKTIIEFLENEIAKHAVGLVLLTGDDVGYSNKEGEGSKKPRSRQNVILELGMLIGYIGRERCIILRQSSVETPSDIDGLIYIAFDNEIEEVKDKLKQKLEGLGMFN